MRLIDADALIDIFEDRLEKIRNRYGDYSGEAGVCAGALHLIRVQPTIEPERKTGQWIRWYETKEDETGTEYIPHCRCSECGTEYDPHSSKFVSFCNVCGAKMEEGEQE